jgi:uncharacterized membrane protein
MDGFDEETDNCDDERILQMTDTQLQKPQHPAFLVVAAQRRAQFHLRLADRITACAGSMRFVELHAAPVRRMDARVREESLAHPYPQRLA